jgi:hypothetical protein
LLALADRLGFGIREVPVHWRAVRGSHVRIVVDSAHMTYQLARISQHSRNHQALSALEAYGRSPETTTAELVERVRAELPVSGPIVPWDKGVLALLPFVEGVDATELAHAVERNLDGVLVRPTTIDAATLLDPAQHRLRTALAHS